MKLRPIWKYSSFGINGVNLITGSDLSSEEARWEYMDEHMKTGNITNYVRSFLKLVE